MIDAIVEGVRVSMMVAAAAGAVGGALAIVFLLVAFGWYLRSSYRSE